MFDFHMHTFLSDGVLAPVELIRRALHAGYKVMAITDHVGGGNLEYVLNTLVRDCEMASRRWDILALPGVEITHTPKEDIDLIARESRALGAKVVNVHGETITEPVEPGTNLASIESPDVDVLAHPGMLSAEEAALAAERGVFLELSARRGHSLTNGRVAAMGLAHGARLLVDSDAHAPEDLLTPAMARGIALGAGLSESHALEALEKNPQRLLRRHGIW